MFSVSLHPSYSYTGYAEKGEQQGVFLKQKSGISLLLSFYPDLFREWAK